MDVSTATEEGANTLVDAALLDLAGAQGRVLLTHDIRFRALAEQWQRLGREFGGLIFGHAEDVSIGQYVRDLELIAKVVNVDELRNSVIYLPL